MGLRTKNKGITACSASARTETSWCWRAWGGSDELYDGEAVVMVPAMLWCLPISVHLLPASLVLAFIRQVVSNFYFCCEGCFQCAASLMCDACAVVWTLDCLK